MYFYVEKIKLDGKLQPKQGWLKAEGIGITSDANVLAQDIIAQAKQEAATMLAATRDEVQHALRHAEQNCLQQASQLLNALQQERQYLLTNMESIALELVQAMFDRLVLETTPADRIRAMLKRVQQEAPPRLTSALLRVHPGDLPLLPQQEWEIKTDTSLQPGSCRLEASTGVWSASFQLAVSELRMMANNHAS